MSNLADLTDPRFTDTERATVARFDTAPFPAEVLLAHLEPDAPASAGDWVTSMTQGLQRIEAAQERINAPRRVWLRVESDPS